MNQDLLYYVAVMRQKHVPDEEIKKNLLDIGWEESAVDEAMAPGADMPKVQVEPPISDEVYAKQGLKFLRTPIIILFLLLSVMTAVIFISRFVRSRGADSGESVSEESEEPSENGKAGQIAVFLTSGNINADPYKVKVNFYDFGKRELLSDLQELVIEDNSQVTLGQWSPDGKFITIQTRPIREKCAECKFITYLYDASNHSVKTVLTFDDNNENFDKYTWAYTNKPYTWLNKEKIVVSADTASGRGSVLTTMDFSGNVSLYNSEHWIAFGNSEFKYSYKSPTETDLGREIDELLVNGSSVSYQFKGIPAGILDSTLITLYVPVGLLVGCDDYTCTPDTKTLDEQYKALENSGLTGDELDKAVFNLIRPAGNDTLYFYDLITGRENKKVTIPSSDWTTSSIHVLKNGKIIVHQLDRKISANKDRFLSIDSRISNPVIVFEGNNISESLGVFTLEQAISGNSTDFYLSPDMDNIIKLASSPVTETVPGSYSASARNISSGDVFEICKNCNSLRIFNPWIPTSAY